MKYLGRIILVNQDAPSTPPSGTTQLWAETTTSPTKRLWFIDDAGNKYALVGISTTEQGANRLKNKDVEASTFNIVDATDTTKQIDFSATGNSAGVVLTLAAQNTSSRTLNFPATRQTETLAVRPQTYFNTPADPTGTNSTTGVMMGVAGSITPQVTGKILIVVTGNLTNSTATAGLGAKAQIRYGTGSAPTNGAALTGTTVGNIVTSVLERATANELQGFACMGMITSGLTLGTAIWIDISLARVGSPGTGLAKNLSVVAFEL